MMLETTVAAGQSAVLPLVVMNQGAADLDVTATANGFVTLDSYALERRVSVKLFIDDVPSLASNP